MARYRGDCWTLEELGLWDTRNCCSSCHEDAEYYGNDYPLGEMRLNVSESIWDDDFMQVCCRVDVDASEVLKKLEEKEREEARQAGGDTGGSGGGDGRDVAGAEHV